MKSLLTLYHPHRKDSVPDSHQLPINIFGLTRIYFNDKNGLVSSVSSCSFIPLPKPDCSSFFPWLPQHSPFSHLFGHSVNRIRELTRVKNERIQNLLALFLPRSIASEFTVQHSIQEHLCWIKHGSIWSGVLPQQQSRHSRCYLRKDVRAGQASRNALPASCDFVTQGCL